MHLKLTTTFLIAALGCVSLYTAAPAGAQQAAAQKKVKDQGEYDLYTAIFKEQDASKRLSLLNTWKEKYPTTDFATERLAFFIASYSALNRAADVITTAQELLKLEPKNAQALSAVIYNVFRLAPGTPEQLAFADTCGKELLGNLDAVLGQKPPNVSDADWTKHRQGITILAHNAVGYIAMQRKEAEAAEKAFLASLGLDPNNGQVSYWLGMVNRTVRSAEKQSAALYHFARAAAYDGPGAYPEQGRKELQGYLEKAYVQYHGDRSGLPELLAQAKTQALPPPDFKIKNATEIAIEKEEEFKKTNPELALWMGLRKELTGDNGMQFFESNMKGAAVPGGAGGIQSLKGRLISAKPAVNSKELVIGVADAATPEVTLKLETPVKGKPVIGSDLNFEGVPETFVKDPFMVTFDQAKVTNLKTETAAPPRRPAAKKAAAKKK